MFVQSGKFVESHGGKLRKISFFRSAQLQ